MYCSPGGHRYPWIYMLCNFLQRLGLQYRLKYGLLFLSFIDDILWSCSELLPLIIFLCYSHTRSIVNPLRAGRSGDRCLIGVRDTSVLQNIQTLCGAHPVGTGLFLQVAGAWSWPLHLLLRQRMSGAEPPLFPYALFLRFLTPSYEPCAFI